MSRLSENQVLLLQPTNEDSSDETEDKSTTTLATLTSTCIPPEKDARLIIIKDKKSTAKNRYFMPDDYVNLSLLGCCMFCPIGVFAILNSYKVQYYFDIGDLDESRESSHRTKTHAKRAIGVGCIIISCVLAFVLTIAVIITALFKPNQYY